MLKVATAKEMQYIDRITINKYGIAGTVLMERAGLAVVERINELFLIPPHPPLTKWGIPEKVIVLCGGGNNGGDGLVIARILHNQGRDVKVFLSVKPEGLKGDAKINYNAAKKTGVDIYPIKMFLTGNRSLATGHCVIVDALIGTGLGKEVRAPLSDIIKKVNRLSSPVIAVDIPSGISSDTGQVMGCSVKANYTVTFGLPKRGHLLYPGAEHTGKLFVEDIGFPQDLLKSDRIRVSLVEDDDIPSLIPERPRYSHKGTYGHVLLIAGSRGKTGAAFMAARSCLRAGAGLVTIGVPETLMDIFQSRVTEEMILPLPDKGNGTLSFKAAGPVLDFINKRGNVLAIGPGISYDEEISRLVGSLVTGSQVPVVIDADGINAISGRTALLKKSRAPVILTPHTGEMARLLQAREKGKGKSVEGVIRKQIEEDRINAAISFAKKTKTFVVLKGVPTVTATPDAEVFINSSGNPGMAKAGTGDVLTGIISSFLAQGLPPGDASVLGVYMHGHTGDIMALKKGRHSLIASDIINAIPQVFKSILRL
jgi:NAD(P)H-hydrate epimerase